MATRVTAAQAVGLRRALAGAIAVLLVLGLGTAQSRAAQATPRWTAFDIPRPPLDTVWLTDAAKPQYQPPPPAAVADTALLPPPPPAPPPAVTVVEPALDPQPAVPTTDPRLVAFSGLSTWVDLYDTELSPQDQVAIAAASGVQTIFVQSARFNSPTDIHDPGRLATLLETAHDAGIRVMVWYIPDFLDPARDLYRAQVAAAFVTLRGDRPDAFGLDIEVDDLPDVAERSRRLLDLSARLRAWAGPDYPMAAIVLPPLQLQLNQTWWPDFPYAELRPYYDVFIPMSYSSYRGQDATVTYEWNLGNVHQTRTLAGDPSLPVHLAGGIADRLPEVNAFVAAAVDGGAIGAGLYDLHTTPATAWPLLLPLRR